MALKTRLMSGAAILAAVCLFLGAVEGMSDLGGRFVGLALIAVLAGGLALTQGLALAGFNKTGGFGAA